MKANSDRQLSRTGKASKRHASDVTPKRVLKFTIKPKREGVRVFWMAPKTDLTKWCKRQENDAYTNEWAVP